MSKTRLADDNDWCPIPNLENSDVAAEADGENSLHRGEEERRDFRLAAGQERVERGVVEANDRLQNTLEQLILFAPGLLVLALDSNGRWMRTVIPATAVWMLARFAFWIGYHFGPQYRVFGLVGMAQSLLVLLYVVGRFGYELGGTVGAAAPVAAFLLIEAFLVLTTPRRKADGRGA